MQTNQVAIEVSIIEKLVKCKSQTILLTE